MKAVTINIDLNSTKKLLDSYSDAINTYNDIKALADRYNYLIEMQQSAMSFFGDINVTMPILTLKPEYAEYIKKYGYPEGGIFESDKIAEILENLGNGENCHDLDDSDDISLKSDTSSIGSSSGNHISSIGSSSGNRISSIGGSSDQH
jgi:hypothetical protein